MRNKRVYCAILVLLMTASALAAAPYATITYAEGKSFSLLRSGKQTTVSVSSPDVFGMEIVPGDVIQTGAGTFLELYINPIAASVQIAENTSFRCDADSTGAKSSGELYYGRVRAKVAKLSGSSSYRISSPSLVAGVRGTDFGCDVIAVRPTRTSAGAVVSAETPILHRVFCFEGSVLVAEAVSDAEAGIAAEGASGGTAGVSLKTVLIGGNEMVEKIVSVDPSTVAAAEQILRKKNISEEVNAFWKGRPVSGPPVASVAPAPFVPSVRTEGRLTITDRPWPRGREAKLLLRDLRVPNTAVVFLSLLGSASCVFASGMYSQADADAGIVHPAYAAGWMMIGSGAALAIISEIARDGIRLRSADTPAAPGTAEDAAPADAMETLPQPASN